MHTFDSYLVNLLGCFLDSTSISSINTRSSHILFKFLLKKYFQTRCAC